MVKEPKNIDFYTTGRVLSDSDFQRISEWISRKKQKLGKTNKAIIARKSITKRSVPN